MSHPMRLRGHHLLCILGFQGFGYSEDFVRHMGELVAQLSADPETPVLLVAGEDDICRHFPEDRPKHCQDASVLQRDERVAGRLGWAAGSVRPWRDVRAALATRFSPEDIPRLCATCPWEPFGFCREGLARLQARLNDRPGCRAP